MAVTRRTFLQSTAAAAAAATLGARLGAATETPAPKGAAKESLKILILGGTGFLGPATIEAALARGHQVTMFNRGKTRPGLFPTVERLQGDRDPKVGEGLKSLAGRDWDVVIDNSAYYPHLVKISAEMLAPHAKQYIIISSISAYKEPNPVNGNESAPLATMPAEALAAGGMGKDLMYYGALKALCEQAATAAMPGRVTVVRPGYIVGPDDTSGRFTYWPVRMDKGGEIAVPGHADDPTQIIDVRDLGAWLVRLAEDKTMGAFNACGPERKLSWGFFVEACHRATKTKSRIIWIPTAFMLKHEEVEFPIWAPAVGDTKGFHTWSNARALAAGLRFRSAEVTAKDTLEWFKGQEKTEGGRTKLAGPSPEAEAKLLSAWKLQKKS